MANIATSNLFANYNAASPPAHTENGNSGTPQRTLKRKDGPQELVKSRTPLLVCRCVVLSYPSFSANQSDPAPKRRRLNTPLKTPLQSPSHASMQRVGMAGAAAGYDGMHGEHDMAFTELSKFDLLHQHLTRILATAPKGISIAFGSLSICYLSTVLDQISGNALHPWIEVDDSMEPGILFSSLVLVRKCFTPSS